MSDTSQNPPSPDEPTTPRSYPPPPQGGYQPGWTPPPSQQPGGVGYPADLLSRFLARLIDYVLLFVVNIFLVSALISGLLMGGNVQPLSVGVAQNYGVNAVSSLLTAAIYLGYFTLMEHNTGRTLGKRIMKLETRGPGGGRPTLQEAVKRNLFTALPALSIIPFVGGYLSSISWLVAVVLIATTISSNPATRQGWHDRFAGGTSVVKIG
jgi:uncharacterized RDD family membrane protein YckC